MPVVVVESPAKAKTIGKFIGKDFRILASFGHVRDLKEKDGSVDPDNEFAMVWEIGRDSGKHLRAIASALDSDQQLFLATDPDREGEAISWHLTEVLTKRKSIKKNTVVKRISFNAITKDAVRAAFREPRELDMHLVDAYLARRALDYLVGFHLSPVLWRKLRGARSAGRVQSVCLRLVVERELEILTFEPREFWTVTARIATPRGDEFKARLVELNGRKLGKFDLNDREAGENAAAAVRNGSLRVNSVEVKTVMRKPPVPLITSTLQQEASRKFRFGTRRTMAAAQKLYEAGHITYMRTDGIHMAPEAVKAARRVVLEDFGTAYLPKTPPKYRNKAKNAQEAHECIRPTDVGRHPSQLASLPPDEAKVYDLVWKRTLASQMSPARLGRTTVEIRSSDELAALRASGQVLEFDGFLKIYEEGRDADSKADEASVQGGRDENQRLPPLTEGENLECREVSPEQHFTKPPPRYSEAMLVKRMVELGVGRPSTYATAVATIQERNYVRKEKNVLHAEEVGILTTAFLKNYFRQYVNFDYTAGLEERLDSISAGRVSYKSVLGDFWADFSQTVDTARDLDFTDVFEGISDELALIAFPDSPTDGDMRLCPNCGKGRLSVRMAKGGSGFIGCSLYPECRYTRPLFSRSRNGNSGALDLAGTGLLLGSDDEGLPVTLRDGRFGLYVQRGEKTEDRARPETASVPESIPGEAVNLETALELLSLPRLVGDHPDGGEIRAGIGRKGPYVVWSVPSQEEKTGSKKTYADLSDPLEALTIGMNRAVELLAQSKRFGSGRGGRRRSEPLRILGDHPAKSGEILVLSGRYGPYLQWNRKNVSIPKTIDPATMSIDTAVELIAAKSASKRRRKKATKR
ncbi:MAG: type I DNA topoisomerase [Rhodobacteraceae bacterium]|nr:type I DNA topoisomerase [Paracoccaceae bacterium]